LPGGGTYVLYVDDDDHLGPGEPTPNHPETGEAMRALNTSVANATLTDLTPGKTYYWHVEALDGSSALVAGSGIQSFVACTGTCNVPPEFLSSANGYAQCGVPYSYSGAGAPVMGGTGPFQFTVGVAAGETAPSGLKVSATTGAFQWTPTKDDEGLHQIQLTATGVGGAATQAYDLVVTCPNGKSAAVGCGCGSIRGGPGPGWWVLLVCIATLRSIRRVRLPQQ
jgi:hypothetical protein